MGLSITVLGCSGTYAGPGGACSGYLVRSNDTSVWVDTGPGSLANLQQHIDLASLDAIVVSHSHPDHWGELGVRAKRAEVRLPDRTHASVLHNCGAQARRDRVR